MNRRDFLQSSSAIASLGLFAGCSGARRPLQAATPTLMLPFYDAVPPLVPIRADADRLFKVTVCTRPFRAAGPRIEAERIQDKLVVHNYGHGGSGWSLSWGSGTVALDLALAGRDPSQTDIAVIGCGALGLTAAILAQRAGARSVTIYAKDRPSESRSFRATGVLDALLPCRSHQVGVLGISGAVGADDPHLLALLPELSGTARNTC